MAKKATKKKPSKEVVFSMKVEEWQKAKSTLDAAKTLEMELRKDIASEILGSRFGETIKHEIGGQQLEAKQEYNLKLDVPVLESLWETLDPSERGCIKVKPSLVKKEYKKLPRNSEFHRAIITTPATPTLKIKDL